METFKVSNLTFRYPETNIDVLKNISFSVNKGEFITLCGHSGCGKSTLLRHLKPVLAPEGIKRGIIIFDGKDINELEQREQSSKIGYVLQSPENQIVTDKVWHELAFGLESLGYDNQTIRKRVAETASFFGIQNWFDKSTTELSGGQKQMLNLASIMAMQPEVLILDEPTSQLDPIAAADFLSCICKINRELGTTVIITEHRLDEILPVSSRVLVIENGELISFDTPQNTGKKLKLLNSKSFLSLPAPMQIWEAVCGDNSNCPVTVTEGREWLENYSKNHKLIEIETENITHSNEIAFEFKDVWFRYEKDSPDVIKDLNLKVYKGEFVTVLGGNGTGKSTMLSLICGIKKPYRGKVIIENNMNACQLPQNPQNLFVKKTVLEDLLEIFDGQKIDDNEKQDRLKEVVGLCKLDSLLNRHPYDLSGGEQQRAALAKILLLKPSILLLDEPTKGIDAEFKIIFARIIKILYNSGVTIVMVSHDVEFCAKYSHRCMMFFNGEIVSENTPRKFFASNSFYTTTANRMSRNIIKDAVTADDVIYACTGKRAEDSVDIDFNLYKSTPNIPIHKNKPVQVNKLPIWKKILGIFSALLFLFGLIVNLDYIDNINSETLPKWANFLLIGIPVVLLMISFGSKSKRSLDEIYTNSGNRKIPKRTLAAAIMILLAIPITIFIGVTYLKDQKYLFISLLVMFECMLPFFLVFESRKPQARELVIISVLCAIAVAGRTAFFMLPQFKPIIAIVIISGVAFGGESGFLVGAMTMLVSNILMQQGPWTPWQMFAAGIIGFIAGILFKKGLLSRNRIALCVFGFISTVVIYGLIMNFSSVVMARATINLATIFSFVVTGFPMDIVHGLATFVFIYFCAEPMLEKLDRIKTKYGLIKQRR
ncbi:MAG: ATP-binding cassette domain-containing protein [Ruminococcus sp.]|nr:ATP-binding cassette domain-containing protein [Ruminococcus sp.]